MRVVTAVEMASVMVAVAVLAVAKAAKVMWGLEILVPVSVPVMVAMPIQMMVVVGVTGKKIGE
jgi:hypothetical protein